MSFILDALKKSETDRQRQGGSEFTGIPTSPQRASVPRWLWIVGPLLAINVVVLIGLLLRPDPATPLQASPAGALTVTPPATGDLHRPSFEEQVAAARENPPDEQSEVAVAASPVNAGNFVKPVLISQDPSSVPASSLYPTMLEVRARGSINLPALHLDIHVFSLEPDDRFVFINMAKLREGSTLAEGPVITEITPDGVVLQHEGQMFLLPRE